MKAILLLLGSLVLLALVFLSGVIITANVIAEPEPHKFANIETPDLWTSKPKEVDPAKQVYERLPDAPRPAVAEASQPSVQQNAPLGHAAQNVATTPAGSPALNAPVDQTLTASVQPAGPGPSPVGQWPPAQMPNGNAEPLPTEVQGPHVDAARAQFCYARYRSYRVQDNSYQPFDGGPRRQCQAPGAPQVDMAAAPTARTAVDRDIAVASTATASRTPDREKPRKLGPLPPEAIPSDEEWQAIESGGGDRETGNPRGANDVEMIESAAPAGSGQAGSHEQWCANRYQSYRTNDNSYQPFDGSPRRACQSPFG